ncbi:MAG TPA: YqgE/AlgH family protein [Gammaproteobacteria bacterium]|nr:YqgE/AlgH family protein [Gammaproteobacteria bacterium]
MSSTFPSLAGHFLIAMPTMTDPSFAQSVVYLLAHDAEGALGLIINRHMGLTLKDIFEQLQPEHGPLDQAHNQDIFSGGPVQAELGFVLHNIGPEFQGTTNFGELALTSSKDALLAIAQGTGPKQSMITLGHAGWGAGQIEDELRANAWLSCPAQHRIIFDTPIEERRSAAAALLGVDLERLSHQVGHS